MSSSLAPQPVVLTAHARNVPASERAALADALSVAPPAGSVVITTCHRVEAYTVATEGETAALAERLPRGGRLLVGEEAIRHLMSVAVGRDSTVLGEDEILHQLRQALDGARASRPVDPTVDRLFSAALHAGRRARSWHQGRRPSLGDAALEAISSVHGELEGRSILVVGAGTIGALAARAAHHAGARVTVANRSPGRARAIADGVNGAAATLDPGSEVVIRADGVIVGLGGLWTLSEATERALIASPAIVVDLSFPPAIPAKLGTRLGSRLVSADQIAATAASDGEGHHHLAARLDAFVDETTAGFVTWLNARGSRAAADELVRRADREREIELDALWRRVPALDADARSAIEDMTRHLAARLLQEPLERLGRDPDGQEGAVIRDVFAL